MLTRYFRKIINSGRFRSGKQPDGAILPAGGERVIIIHNHIFKNAGSSIDWALRKNFGQGFVDHRDDRKMLQGPGYLGPYLAENPLITALSTHHLRPPLPEMENTRIMTIMMFRHPIERVTSVYNFERAQTRAGTFGARFARKHGLGEYVLWRMRPDVPPTIRNFHVFRSLPAPVNWREEVGPAQLEKAVEFVESVDLLGFVDSFDQSMVLFEEVLKPFYPDIDLSCRVQNVSQRLDEPRPERLRRLEREAGGQAFDLLIKRNTMDMKLYEYAWKIFQKRTGRILDLELKRQDFQARCLKHGPGPES